jgi:hypothetical protein
MLYIFCGLGLAVVATVPCLIFLFGTYNSLPGCYYQEMLLLYLFSSLSVL